MLKYKSQIMHFLFFFVFLFVVFACVNFFVGKINLSSVDMEYTISSEQSQGAK